MRRKTRTSFINIAPLVDVVFLLLLFFVLTHHFAQNELMEMVLPKAATGAADTLDAVTVYIGQEGGISIEEEPVSLEEMTRRMADPDGEAPPVRIAAHAKAPVDALVGVMDALSMAGRRSVHVAVEPKKKLERL
jgi:biopolymer transport protein ExbD